MCDELVQKMDQNLELLVVEENKSNHPAICPCIGESGFFDEDNLATIHSIDNPDERSREKNRALQLLNIINTQDNQLLEQQNYKLTKELKEMEEKYLNKMEIFQKEKNRKIIEIQKIHEEDLNILNTSYEKERIFLCNWYNTELNKRDYINSKNLRNVMKQHKTITAKIENDFEDSLLKYREIINEFIDTKLASESGHFDKNIDDDKSNNLNNGDDFVKLCSNAKCIANHERALKLEQKLSEVNNSKRYSSNEYKINDTNINNNSGWNILKIKWEKDNKELCLIIENENDI